VSKAAVVDEFAREVNMRLKGYALHTSTCTGRSVATEFGDIVKWVYEDEVCRDYFG
jgi:hypothetical protein